MIAERPGGAAIDGLRVGVEDLAEVEHARGGAEGSGGRSADLHVDALFGHEARSGHGDDLAPGQVGRPVSRVHISDTHQICRSEK